MAFEFPSIDPVALAIGPVEIRWYALAYMAGFILGWRYCLYLADRFKGVKGVPDREQIDDFLPWAIIGVILGGRLGYALFYNSTFYLENPEAIFKIWQGGMSFHGGFIGLVWAAYLYAEKHKLSFFRLTDLLACVAPIGLFFGRIANFINGELFGRVALDLPWAVRFPQGGDTPRHPSQLYEAILEGLVLFLVLFILSRGEKLKAYSGVLSGVFLIGYGASRAFVELFREPDAHIGLIEDVLSMGQILSLPMVLAGFVLVFYATRNTDKKTDASDSKQDAKQDKKA